MSKRLPVLPPPRLWQRYVDDTFIIQKEIHKQGFLQHINSIDPATQFTVEKNKEDGAIPFLDTIVKPEADGKLSITVYRKPTNTGQYLQWDSHHHLSAKLSVIQILTHRAQTVCSNPELLHKEKAHLRKALTQCKYPKWALDKLDKRLRWPSREVSNGANNQGTTGAQPATNEVKTKGHIVMPCTQGLCENVKKIYGSMAYIPTSKVVILSGTYWSPCRTKTLWAAKVGPYIGSIVVTSPVMMNI